MKKRFRLLCLLLCAGLLTACAASPTEENPESAGDSEATVELTLAAFPVGNWGNPTTVSNLLAGFHSQYPKIHITVDYLNYETGDEEIEQAAANGSAPDLVLEGPERLVANWGERGWMADLSDLWETEQAAGIYEPVRRACQHRNGAYYEVPICVSAHCMAINYDLFQAAGALEYLDQEHHTWTTEGFLQAVRALRDYGMEKAGVVYCKNQSGDQGTRALVNNLYGGSFTDDAHTRYTVDSEANIRALRLLYDLEGITFDPALSAGDAIQQFCKKETAMCFCWNGSVEVQQTINNPDFDFEVFPMAFPTNEGTPRLQSGVWGFGIFDNGDGQRVEAAKTFIRYITTDDGVYTRAVRTSSYWPVRDIGNIYENDMLMTEYSVFMPYMGDYYQITPGWADARTAWWQVLSDIAGGTDAAQAVKDFPAPR